MGGGPRVVEVTLVLDVSGSMLADGKIQALNSAGRGLVTLLAGEEASSGLRIRLRRLAAGDEASWLDEAHRSVSELSWTPVVARERASSELGVALAAAFSDHGERSVADPECHRAVVVVTDGLPSDLMAPTFDEVVTWIDTDAAVASVTRIALLIGRDADAAAMRPFVSNPDTDLLEARRLEVLADRLVTAAHRSLP